MKTIAKILLGFAFALMMIQLGTWIGWHRTAGDDNIEHNAARDVCKNRQSLLLPLEQPNWSAAQNEALKLICTDTTFRRSPQLDSIPLLIWLVPLLLGGLLFIGSCMRNTKPNTQ